GRSVFLLPTRALVNEQYGKFTATYGPLGLQTIRATGEHSDDVPALLQGQFDLAVLTYEKVRRAGPRQRPPAQDAVGRGDRRAAEPRRSRARSLPRIPSDAAESAAFGRCRAADRGALGGAGRPRRLGQLA